VDILVDNVLEHTTGAVLVHDDSDQYKQPVIAVVMGDKSELPHNTVEAVRYCLETWFLELGFQNAMRTDGKTVRVYYTNETGATVLTVP